MNIHFMSTVYPNIAICCMVQLPSGRYQMGTNLPDVRGGEGPVWEVTVKPLLINIFPITNKDFQVHQVLFQE